MGNCMRMKLLCRCYCLKYSFLKTFHAFHFRSLWRTQNFDNKNLPIYSIYMYMYIWWILFRQTLHNEMFPVLLSFHVPIGHHSNFAKETVHTYMHTMSEPILSINNLAVVGMSNRRVAYIPVMSQTASLAKCALLVHAKGIKTLCKCTHTLW